MFGAVIHGRLRMFFSFLTRTPPMPFHTLKLLNSDIDEHDRLAALSQKQNGH